MDTDPTLAPFVGQTFNVWQEFHDYMTRYKEATAQPFIKVYCMPSETANSRLKSNGVKYPEGEGFKYTDYTYACKHFPRKNKKYNNNPSLGFQNNCPVRVCAGFDRFKKVIVIKLTELGHNHPLGQFWNYRGNLDNRRLSQDEREELVSLDLSYKDLIEYVNKHLNIKLSYQQVYDMRRRVKQRKERLKNLEKDKENNSAQSQEVVEGEKKDATNESILSSKDMQTETSASCDVSEKIIGLKEGFMKEGKCGEGIRINDSCSQNDKVINCLDAKGLSCNKDTLLDSSNYFHKDTRIESEYKKDDNDFLVTSNSKTHINVSVDKGDRNSLKRKVIEILDDDDDDTSPPIHVNKKAKVADDDMVLDVNKNGEFNTSASEILKKKLCKLSKTKNDQDCSKMKEPGDPNLLKSSDVELKLNVDNNKITENNYYKSKNTLDDTGTKDRAKTEVVKDVNENCLSTSIDEDTTSESDKINVILVDDDSDIDNKDNKVRKERRKEEKVRLKKKRKKDIIVQEKENDEDNIEVKEKNDDNYVVNKESTHYVVRKKKKKRKRDDRNDEIDEENVEVTEKKQLCRIDQLEDKLVGDKLMNNGNVTNDVILIGDESDSDQCLKIKENSVKEHKKAKKKKNGHKENRTEQENDVIENSLCKESREIKRKKKRDVNIEENGSNEDCLRNEHIAIIAEEENYAKENLLCEENRESKRKKKKKKKNKEAILDTERKGLNEECLRIENITPLKTDEENYAVVNSPCDEHIETKPKKKKKKKNNEAIFDSEEKILNEDCLRNENITSLKFDEENYDIVNSPCDEHLETKRKKKKKKKTCRDDNMKEKERNQGCSLRDDKLISNPKSEKEIILIDDEEIVEKIINFPTIDIDEEKEVLKDGNNIMKGKSGDSMLCEQIDVSDDTVAYKAKRRKKSKKNVVWNLDENNAEEYLVSNIFEETVIKKKKKKKKKETSLIVDENDTNTIETPIRNEEEIDVKRNKKRKEKDCTENLVGKYEEGESKRKKKKKKEHALISKSDEKDTNTNETTTRNGEESEIKRKKKEKKRSVLSQEKLSPVNETLVRNSNLNEEIAFKTKKKKKTIIVLSEENDFIINTKETSNQNIETEIKKKKKRKKKSLLLSDEKECEESLVGNENTESKDKRKKLKKQKEKNIVVSDEEVFKENLVRNCEETDMKSKNKKKKKKDSK